MKEAEATLKGPDGAVKRLFAGAAADALEWFRRSYKDENGAMPTPDEEKYFADGHDVIVKGLTWRFAKTKRPGEPV